MFKETDLKKPYKLVVIGGSAGSLKVLSKILNAIPSDFSLPIVLCCHRLKHVRSGFVEALALKSAKEVIEPEDKEMIKKGMVYLAPANYHLSLEVGKTIALSTEEMINNSRPSIDITLESAAFAYTDKLIGILLTGANKDGAMGMKKIKDKGGLTIVQEPSECFIDTMPKAALSVTPIDYVLRTDQIIEFLKQLDRYQKIN